MLKQLIVTITALVLMNGVINLAVADGWWDEEFKNHSQIGYYDTQNGNDNTKKDIIVSDSEQFNHGLGYYNDSLFEKEEITVTDRENWWQWY